MSIEQVEQGITKTTDLNGKVLYRIRVDRFDPRDRRLRVQKECKTSEGLAKARALKKALVFKAGQELEQMTRRTETWEVCLEKWSAYTHGRSMEEGADKELSLRLRDAQSLLAKFTGDWRKRPISEINSLDVMELFGRMRKDGYSESRIRAIRYAINKVYRWTSHSRLLPQNHPVPTEGIEPGPKKAEREPPILTLDSLRNLLLRAKVSESEWYPVWSMAAATGMRSGELFALKWGDVDLDQDLIHVRQSFNFRAKLIKGTKSGRIRQVPINSELKALLLGLKTTGGTREWVLPRIPRWDHGETSRHVKLFCKSIGLKQITFHTFRACFATHMLQSGVPMPKVKSICGWQDTKTMDIYLRMAGVDVKGATEHFKLLPPDSATSNVVLIRRGDGA